tara:strand:+ start:731 stop:1741 length:1011 start_codon:yes stop_codon:yes gene_type:complete
MLITSKGDFVPCEVSRGGMAKDILCDHLRCYSKKLKNILRCQYNRVLKELGKVDFDRYPLTSLEKEQLISFSRAPLTINTSLDLLEKNDVKRGLSNAHVDREIAEYKLFGIPYQSKKLAFDGNEARRKFYTNQDDTGVKNMLKSIPQGEWGRGVWNLNVPLSQHKQKTHLYGGARPIYGSLNFTKSLAGGASAYGGVVIELQHDVRMRSTFVVGDSFDYINALQEYSTTQFPLVTIDNLDLLYIANYKMSSMLESLSTTYIEAQIFGGVSFQNDIRSIRIPISDIKALSFESFDKIQKKWDPNHKISWNVYDDNTCYSVEKYYEKGLHFFSFFSNG